MTTMTFQESYGSMPATLWTLVKRHNLSPVDFWDMEVLCDEDYDAIIVAVSNPDFRIGTSFSVWKFRDSLKDY